jgi:hypothetical protein
MILFDFCGPGAQCIPVILFGPGPTVDLYLPSVLKHELIWYGLTYTQDTGLFFNSWTGATRDIETELI